ncbi:MAG: hypothetical protein ACOC5C_06295 [Halobacteriota archaeon]
MHVEERLDKIERELQDLKSLLVFERETLIKRKPVSLRGMGKILVSEDELEKSIESAKKSVSSDKDVLCD